MYFNQIKCSGGSKKGKRILLSLCPVVKKKWQAKVLLQISCFMSLSHNFLDPLLNSISMIKLDTSATVLTDPVVEVSHVGVNGW